MEGSTCILPQSNTPSPALWPPRLWRRRPRARFAKRCVNWRAGSASLRSAQATIAQVSPLPRLRRSRAFAVNLLSADQQEHAEQFAGRSGLQGSERYQGGLWRSLPSGALCLANSIASFDCEIEDMIERHTHAILIGRVRHVFIDAASGALVYWRGAYDQLGWSGDQIARATGLAPIRSRPNRKAGLGFKA
jgi:Flavin reductase like domain